MVHINYLFYYYLLSNFYQFLDNYEKKKNGSSLFIVLEIVKVVIPTINIQIYK